MPWLECAPRSHDSTERTAGVDLASAAFTLSRHRLKRYRVGIPRSVEILIHTFVERFAMFMNAIAELFTGLGSAGVSELLYALRRIIAGLNRVQARNAHRAKDNGGEHSGKEKRREFIVQEPSEKNAETRIKQAYSVPGEKGALTRTFLSLKIAFEAFLLCYVVGICRTIKRKDVFPFLIIPAEKKQISQHHQRRGEERAFKAHRVRENTNVQDDGEIEKCAERDRARNQQHDRRRHLHDADEGVVITRMMQGFQVMPHRMING